MSVNELAEKADMIVSGYGFFKKGDYVEVIDLNDITKKSTIQNDEVVESVMDDTEDDIVIDYYLRNKNIMEESIDAKIFSL